MLGPQAFSSTTTNGGAKTNNTEETNDDEEGGEINLIQKLDDNIQSNPFAVVMFLNNDLSTVRYLYLILNLDFSGSFFAI